MIKSTDLDAIANSFMQQVLAIKQEAYTKEWQSSEQMDLFRIANDIWAVASRLWPLSAQLRIEEQHDTHTVSSTIQTVGVHHGRSNTLDTN